ncbi:apolipoprotein N-acyltransferase [Pseudomonadota bacterium]
MLEFLFKKENGKYYWSFLFGSLSSLSFAPVFLFPVLWVCLPYLLLSIQNNNKALNTKSSFFFGWWFGFGHFIIGTYWICSSLLVEPEKFAWLLPFAITIIPGFLALFIVITFCGTFYLTQKLNLRKIEIIILFAVLWSFSEILRTFIFTGFPWNLIGYVWGFSDKMIQVSSIFGTYILGFLTIIIFSSPFLLIDYQKNIKKRDKYAKKHKTIKEDFNFLLKCYKINVSRNKLISFFICFSLLPSIYFYGLNRLNFGKYLSDTEKIARIIQPNIPQSEKWNPNTQILSLRKQLEMASYNSKNLNYVILPEAAIPYILNKNVRLLNFIKDSFPDNIILITGGLRAEYKENSNEINKLWNSVFIIRNGKIVNYYDKIHLVPFGEYIPFRYLFGSFIKKITYGGMDFSRGKDKKIISLNNNLNVRFLVCYEVIFPNEILDHKNNTLNLIINLTNDAWFGTTSGPYQHLISAKYRAVEYGVPIIRAANTGISAYINPYGKIIDKIGLNVENYLDIKISENLNRTVYSKYKKYSILFFFYFLGLIIFYNKEGRSRR